MVAARWVLYKLLGVRGGNIDETVGQYHMSIGQVAWAHRACQSFALLSKYPYIWELTTRIDSKLCLSYCLRMDMASNWAVGSDCLVWPVNPLVLGNRDSSLATGIRCRFNGCDAGPPVNQHRMRVIFLGIPLVLLLSIRHYRGRRAGIVLKTNCSPRSARKSPDKVQGYQMSCERTGILSRCGADPLLSVHRIGQDTERVDRHQ